MARKNTLKTDFDPLNSTYIAFKARLQWVRDTYNIGETRWVAPRTIYTLMGIDKNWQRSMLAKTTIAGAKKADLLYQLLAVGEQARFKGVLEEGKTDVLARIVDSGWYANGLNPSEEQATDTRQAIIKFVQTYDKDKPE